ncbi:MAG: PD40 domain-containing protein [Clostridia bacterium]|nr:PD40 domain-containing protein [Clostridia bacterium]
MLERMPSESRWTRDEKTGRPVRQVTCAPAISHHPFFLAPAYDGSGRYLIFVSFRTGSGQLYAEDSREGGILRLTDVEALDEWSVYPSGEHVYFAANGGAMRVSLADGTVETLLCAQACRERFGGPVGEGTTALTKDGRFWAVRVKQEKGFAIIIRDNASGEWSLSYEGPMVAHLQFCPDDDNLLFFAGLLTDRVWVLDRKRGQARRIYTRNAAAKQWITHESWIPGRRELSLVDWPHGVLGVNVDTGAVRRIADFNAWHAVCNEDGTLMAADTNFPDRGIFLFDPRREGDAPRLLCCPEASCMGAHWAEPFPYDNGPVRVYAPQHTHPHPRFSPDGSKLVFTSDRSGTAQLYEINLKDKGD